MNQKLGDNIFKIYPVQWSFLVAKKLSAGLRKVRYRNFSMSSNMNQKLGDLNKFKIYPVHWSSLVAKKTTSGITQRTLQELLNVVEYESKT